MVNNRAKPMSMTSGIFCVLISLYLLIQLIHIDPSHFTVKHSALYETDHRSLFEFVTHASTVENVSTLASCIYLQALC